MPRVITPMVVDLYHGDEVTDWTRVRESGIVGVIHKATQGTRMVDPTYALRRDAARRAGLLWGAYHFGTNAPVDEQVEHFLAHAQPDGDMLLALDWEEYRNITMTRGQAVRFLQLLEAKTGRKAVLYSGNLLKQQVPKADPYLAAHRLWLAQYGPRPVCPPGWSRPWLWQYTGDGVGSLPHSVPGIKTQGIDLNQFDGTADDLRAEWVGEASTWAPVVTATAADAAPAPAGPAPISHLGQSTTIQTAAVTGATGAASGATMLSKAVSSMAASGSVSATAFLLALASDPEFWAALTVIAVSIAGSAYIISERVRHFMSWGR